MGTDESIESSVEDKPLSERTTENVTDKAPGKLKQAFSFLKAKAKAKASGLKESAAHKWEAGKETGKSAGRTAIRGAVNFAHSPKTTTGNAAVSTALYARGKYTAAKEKGSSALQSAGAGLKALKENPKDTIKTGKAKIGQGLKGIKDRAASVPTRIKNKMPTRSKSISLPSLKSLFNRSAKSVPPPPSLAVKNAIDTAAQKAQQLSGQVKDAGETLQQAKSDKANLKQLAQLLNDPSGFYKSGVEAKVSWNGETVNIGGEGLEKTRSVSAALKLARAHQKEIRAGFNAAREVVTDMKAGKKDLKAEVKQEIKTVRKQASASKKENYTQQLTDLKTTRSSLKEKITEMKKLAEAAASEGKTEVVASRKSLRVQLKVDSEHLKALKKEIKNEEQHAERQTKSIRKDFSTVRSAIKTYETILKKSSIDYERKAAQEGLNAAEQKRDRLVEDLEAVQKTLENNTVELKSEVSETSKSIDAGKQAIAMTKGKGGGSTAFEELKTQWQAAKSELEQNTKDIRALQQQYKTDQSAIKNLK